MVKLSKAEREQRTRIARAALNRKRQENLDAVGARPVSLMDVDTPPSPRVDHNEFCSLPETTASVPPMSSDGLEIIREVVVPMTTTESLTRIVNATAQKKSRESTKVEPPFDLQRSSSNHKIHVQ
jgi:hypothetical protein